MPSPPKSAQPPLSLTGILLRAALVGLLTSMTVGVIALRVSAAQGGALPFNALVAITAVRLLAFPLGFALTYRRLRGRLSMQTTATTRLMRAAGVGFMAWVGVNLVQACLSSGWQLSLPPGSASLAGIATAAAWWWRRRAPAQARTTALRPPGAWGTFVALAFGLAAGAIAVFASIFFWQRTPYAWAPFVAGPLAMYVLYRGVIGLARAGVLRSPLEIVGAVVTEGTALGATVELLSDD